VILAQLHAPECDRTSNARDPDLALALTRGRSAADCRIDLARRNRPYLLRSCGIIRV